MHSYDLGRNGNGEAVSVHYNSDFSGSVVFIAARGAGIENTQCVDVPFSALSEWFAREFLTSIILKRVQNALSKATPEEIIYNWHKIVNDGLVK